MISSGTAYLDCFGFFLLNHKARDASLPMVQSPDIILETACRLFNYTSALVFFPTVRQLPTHCATACSNNIYLKDIISDDPFTALYVGFRESSNFSDHLL